MKHEVVQKFDNEFVKPEGLLGRLSRLSNVLGWP